MEENTKRMQQDAYRRIQEMQSKAKNPTEKNQSEQQQNNENPKSAEPPFSNLNNNANCFDNNTKKDILETLMQDKERYLILILLLILVGESADMDILLALMYLLI